ncbi:phthalyl amidase [Seongchinamella sediminis]|uniref:Phthalyl amidase n=2 Tax=Seongchinamella sediminis TaxID=2283635 RepID=A0A3L7E067_9GAMM|nr:phthalyl amidase [Seongchinamella sediminis]
MASLLLLLASGSQAAKPPQYYVDQSKLPFEALPGAQAYWGVHAGAGYQIEVPDNWNGSLVVWAHGYRGTGLELTVDPHPLRQALIPNGYAWAASSYTRNDYDISAGVQSTHALIKRFRGLVGKPSQILMTGASMGGHITGVIIEQYPGLFAGAMPICGVMADHELFDFFLDFNLAAQQLGVGGSTYPIDAATYLFGTVPAIKSNLEAVPGGWPGALNDTGNNFKNLVEIRSGGERPNFDEAWFFWNTVPNNGSGPGNFLFDLAVGDGSLPRAPGSVVDNLDTVYQFDTDPALTPEEQALNDLIFRIGADPQTRRKQGLAQVPTITGDIDIPVLTLHNLGDLFVPVLNQVEYAKRVFDQGNSDLLVQRAIRGVAHCGFTGNELVTAFFDLVNWIESGQQPAGDNFLDPAAVADPEFGCQFSDAAGHLLATPCP